MEDKATNRSKSEKITSSEQASVFLVEEDPEARRTLRTLLQRWGYTVIAKKTTREAENFLVEVKGENIGLIIFDMNLHPVSRELEGYAFFRRQTVVNPGLPFILISTDYTIWDLPAVRSMAEHYLTKPFDPEVLRTVVRSTLKARNE
jgi:DNA-binding NtrC family response regulator